MGTDRIKVAENNNAPVGVGSVQIAQHLFNKKLGPPIRVGGARRGIFPDRQTLRITVDCRRRTKDQALAAILRHHLTENGGPADIILIIGKRFFDRLTDRLQAGKMNDRLGTMGSKDLPQRFPVTDIGLDKLRGNAGDLGNPL